MKILTGAFFCLWLSLLVAAGVCSGDHDTIEVVGFGECEDCAKSNIQTSHAFSGLGVTIDCKTSIKEDHYKTKGNGKLNEDGSFKISLPRQLLTKDGELNEQCFAQLHSAAAAPCAIHGGSDSSKLIFKSKTNGKFTFGLAGKLKFSPETCTSEVLWHHYKHPPLTKFPPFKHFGHHHHLFFSHPPVLTPAPKFKKPEPSPEPKSKKPKPSPEPKFKKPKPSPAPKFKKPHPTPVPVIKKPYPPPVPVYKKPSPAPTPVYKKKPCPPLPPLPKIPPKHFHHPKFGKLPPIPSHP